MSALPVQETESVLAELPQPKGPGARLKAARQSRDISLDTVAAQLHLRRDMLIALEEDDYDHLPARVFIVGYMRNYARYIGLPPEAIIQSLDNFLPPEEKDQPGLPKVGSGTGEIFKPSTKARKSPFSFFSLILLVAAVAAFFIWKEGYLQNASTEVAMTEKLTPVQQTEVEQPVLKFAVPEVNEASPDVLEEESPETLEVVVAEEPLSEVQETVVDEAESAEPPEVQVVVDETVDSIIPGASGVVLKLSGKSWIEVRDSTGTFTLNNLYQAGTEQIFGGKPPYKVLIGNVAEALLTVNGVEFNLENYNKANVARFTLDPSTL